MGQLVVELVDVVWHLDRLKERLHKMMLTLFLDGYLVEVTLGQENTIWMQQLSRTRPLLRSQAQTLLDNLLQLL